VGDLQVFGFAGKSANETYGTATRGRQTVDYGVLLMKTGSPDHLSAQPLAIINASGVVASDGSAVSARVERVCAAQYVSSGVSFERQAVRVALTSGTYTLSLDPSGTNASTVGEIPIGGNLKTRLIPGALYSWWLIMPNGPSNPVKRRSVPAILSRGMQEQRILLMRSRRWRQGLQRTLA